MKKSRIIVPAMAMIAFTSLASIAGSVAWFTASRQVTITAGTYTVVKTTTNLEYNITAGVGTSVSANVVSLGNSLLTDASFNHKTGKLFYPREDGLALADELYETTGGENPTATKDGIDLGAMTLATETGTDEQKTAAVTALEDALLRATDGTGVSQKKIWSAVTWTVDFTISFGATSGDYGLFLNNTESQSAFTTTGTALTAKGFRMGFYPIGETPSNSDRKAKVFADLQTADNCKYIATAADLNDISGTAYVAENHDLIDSSYNTALPDSTTERATAIARNDYLGMFKFQASTRVTLRYLVVAWFEGTDEEIVNRDVASEYQSVTANLVFDAVKLKDAA